MPLERDSHGTREKKILGPGPYGDLLAKRLHGIAGSSTVKASKKQPSLQNQVFPLSFAAGFWKLAEQLWWNKFQLEFSGGQWVQKEAEVSN